MSLNRKRGGMQESLLATSKRVSNVRNRANEKYLRDSNLQYEKEYMKAMNKYQNDRMEIRHDLTLLQNDLRQLATNKSKYYYSPYQSKGSSEAGVEKNDHVPKSHRKRSCSSPKKRDSTLPNVDISKGTPQVGVIPSKKVNSRRGSNASSISGSSKLEGLLDGSIRLPKINCKEMDMKAQDKPITAKVPHAKTDLEILKPKPVDLGRKEVPKKADKLTGLPIIQHRTHTPKRHVHFDESNLRATKSSPPSHFRKSPKIVGTKICVEDQELPPVLEKFMVRLNPEDSGNVVEHKHNPIRKWKMAVNTMSAMNHMYHMSKVVLAVKTKVRENEMRSHMGEDVKLRIQRPHLTSYLLSRQDGHGAASLDTLTPKSKSRTARGMPRYSMSRVDERRDTNNRRLKKTLRELNMDMRTVDQMEAEEFRMRLVQKPSHTS